MRIFSGRWMYRRVVRELAGIRAGIEAQNRLLARIAAILAPEVPVASPTDLADTGVGWVDPAEQALVDAYRERTRRDTGREPTDDEILIYLADERTIDLHQRLLARDGELERARLGRER